MKHSRGRRAGTRQLLRKSPREKGFPPPISRIIWPYKNGDYVAIVIDSSVHKGMPHPRFHGKTGVIIGRQGRAFIVRIRDGGMYKKIYVLPEHLRPIKVKSGQQS